MVYGIVLLGTLPILVHVGPATALVSALVFGSAFMAGPTAVTAISRHVLQPGGLWLSPILLAAAAAVAYLQDHHPHHSEVMQTVRL